MKTKLLATIAGLLLPIALLTTSAHAAPAPAPERATYQPSWHKVHFHMNAYDGAGPGATCHGYSSDPHGWCLGYGETFHNALSYPFEGHVDWYWEDHSRRCPDFEGRDAHHWPRELYLRKPSGYGVSGLCGWLDRHWGTFRITSGQVLIDGHTRHVQTTTGVVADREHVQGGPLFVHYSHRGGHGYVLGMRGWLRY